MITEPENVAELLLRVADAYAGQHRSAGRAREATTTSAYAVVIEGEPGSYSAYVPALPGCVATGRTVEQIEDRIREAIRLHIDSLRTHGEPVPEPSTAAVRLVDVA